MRACWLRRSSRSCQTTGLHPVFRSTPRSPLASSRALHYRASAPELQHPRHLRKYPSSWRFHFRRAPGCGSENVEIRGTSSRWRCTTPIPWCPSVPIRWRPHLCFENRLARARVPTAQTLCSCGPSPWHQRWAIAVMHDIIPQAHPLFHAFKHHDPVLDQCYVSGCQASQARPGHTSTMKATACRTLH
jgi:hypothetical protein